MDCGESLDVPSFFICPISLQIMKDPVTISTGMTFDRDSIQKWLFDYKHIACPITKQPLSDFSLTPNSNLLRLILSWHLHAHESSTTMSSVEKKQNNDSLIPLISIHIEEMKQPHLQVKSLRKIKTLICNKTMEGVDVLFSSVASLIPKSEYLSESSIVIDEALSVLCLLKPCDETLKLVSENENGVLIWSLCTITTKYLHSQARIQAALLLKSIFKVVDGVYKEGLKEEFFESMTEILKDQNSIQGSMAVLDILIQALAFGRNKEKAIKVGLVAVIVELLAENNERRACEMMLVVLEILCKTAEGRAAFVGHPMGVVAVSSMIMRISHLGDEKAIILLHRVVRSCKSDEIAQEFVEVGTVAKVFMLLQSACNSNTKVKAMEILGFFKGTWRKSPCFLSSFRA